MPVWPTPGSGTRHGDRPQAAGADPAPVRRRVGDPAPGPAVSRALLSLGSNLGDRYDHLQRGGGRSGRRGAGGVGDLRDAAVGRPGPAGVPQRGGPGRRRRRAGDLAGSGGGAGARRPGGSAIPQRRFGPRTLDVDVIAVWTDADEPVISGDPRADPAAPAGPSARVRAATVDRHPAVRAAARTRPGHRSPAGGAGGGRPAGPGAAAGPAAPPGRAVITVGRVR